ncbi:hypothetical protein [Wenzhouxiangella sp. XN24]|uniref:hypothetical protein n=1 Tax=Wenzhouxiangella sp. XN24 TaxID=2713569 RepID=UPI0013EC9527|nr:hypothetical protein [Wenzhouxiangella sp. XN24]NGX16780.1 hypothetical protein [Wenzhouxiangella sp. XN24]
MRTFISRSTLFVSLLVLFSSVVVADEVVHGSVVAEINEHGNLVIVLDGFVGPGQPEDGIADTVFVFAASDEAALSPLVSRLSDATSRVNIDYKRDAERAVLKINVPATVNYWLVVDAIADGSGSLGKSPAGSPTMLAGLALSRVDVTAKAWTMDDAIEDYRDFDILAPGPDRSE